MQLGKKLLILFFVIIFAGLYWNGAVKQLKFVNINMDATDQSVYMRYAQSMYENNYNFIGHRNQMPVYPFIQSLFYRSGMSDNELFLTGKYVNIILSMILLLLIGLILRQSFNWLHGLILFLIFSFTVFIFKAGYFQSELLFYFLNLCFFLLVFKLLKEPSWPLAILTGLVGGLAHLTKASILPGLLIFLIIASIKGGWAVYKYWQSKPEGIQAKQMKLYLLVVPLVGLSFLVTVFPYIQTSKRVFGSYFYNVNSTYFMWYDSWEEAKQDIGAHGYLEGPPDMPPDEIPSMSRYLREHTLNDILQRFNMGGERIIKNMANSYGYFKYFLIYLIVLIITQIFNWAKHRKMPQLDLFNLVFLSAYFGLYFLLYSWYVPIAEGNRLVLAQFMPAMFAISLGLQETLKTSVVKLFERPVPALFVINGVVLLVLLVDIYLILTVRIINTWSGS